MDALIACFDKCDLGKSAPVVAVGLASAVVRFVREKEVPAGCAAFKSAAARYVTPAAIARQQQCGMTGVGTGTSRARSPMHHERPVVTATASMGALIY